MPVPNPKTLRPSRRLAWALILGGGITLAFGAGTGDEDNYFDPLPKSEARKAAEKEKAERAKAEKAERAEKQRQAEERRAEERRAAEAARMREERDTLTDEPEDNYFALPPPAAKGGKGGKGSRDDGAGGSEASPADAGDIFADVAERVLPSVVSVTRRSGSGGGLGSGVVAGPPGYVLTSNHVIEGEGSLKVRLADGRELEARRVAADAATDVAVLRILASQKVKESLRPIKFGDSDALRVGEGVAAIGSPYGLSESVTTGIVSAKGRRHPDLSEYGRLIQTDAAINPGSSGGALVNRKGELVGINTAIVSGSGGIGFAIPSNLARKVMDDLLRDGAVSRGWLGVSARDGAAVSSSGTTLRGARVDAVTPGSPGEAAGLRRGDLIVAMAAERAGTKHSVRGADDLLEQVALTRPGSRAVLDIIRGKGRREIEVRLGRRAPRPASAIAKAGAGRSGTISRDGDGESGDGDTWEGDSGERLDHDDGAEGARLGMSVAPATAKLRKRYGLEPEDAGRLVVTAVEKGGGADDADLRAGDVLLEADRKRIVGIESLRAAVARAGRAGRAAKVALTLRRDGETLRKTVRLIPGSV